MWSEASHLFCWFWSPSERICLFLPCLGSPSGSYKVISNGFPFAGLEVAWESLFCETKLDVTSDDLGSLWWAPQYDLRPATTCSVHCDLFIKPMFQVNTGRNLCHIWGHLMQVSTDCYLFHSCGHLARGTGHPMATCCLSEVCGPLRDFRNSAVWPVSVSFCEKLAV